MTGAGHPRPVANRARVIAAVTLMAAVTASGCGEPRTLPQQHQQQGNDGGTATGGASPGDAAGPPSRDVGSGGITETGGSGGTGTGNPAMTDGSGGTRAGGASGGGSGSGDGAPAASGGSAPPSDAGPPDTAGTTEPTSPGALTIAPSASHDFGVVEVGTSGTTTFTVTNTSDAPTGPLTLTNDAPNDVAPSGCGASVAGHGTCTLSVTFTARAAGRRIGKLVLSASAGGALAITVSATGAYRLTVMTSGIGAVTSSPTGLTCNGSTCTGLFSGPVSVRSIPGTDQLFAGWSGGGCPTGMVRECPLNLGGATTVTASFVAQTDNLAFITSMAVPTTLGAPSNYDKRCNDAATAAGINNSAGNAFVALVSSSTSDVTARIGNARGWQRLDGRPVIDTLAAALTTKEVFNAVVFDEKGVARFDAVVLTGIGPDGRVDTKYNCADFTASTGYVDGALSDGGAYHWSTGILAQCSVNSFLMCLGKSRSRTVKPAVTTGRRIWVSSTPFEVGAGMTPDAFCQATRPSGVTTSAAFLATQARTGSGILSSTQIYVRLDGTVVGTGAQIGAGNLESGIWQQSDGTYLSPVVPVWTGSVRPDVTGTSDSTCVDWANMSTMAAATVGYPNQLSKFWQRTTASCTSTTPRLYCVVTAP